MYRDFPTSLHSVSSPANFDFPTSLPSVSSPANFDFPTSLHSVASPANFEFRQLYVKYARDFTPGANELIDWFA